MDTPLFTTSNMIVIYNKGRDSIKFAWAPLYHSSLVCVYS